MGIPGNALKLELAQKKVSFHSGTKIQLGSGWNPGRIGLEKVELSAAPARRVKMAISSQRSILTRNELVGFFRWDARLESKPHTSRVHHQLYYIGRGQHVSPSYPTPWLRDIDDLQQSADAPLVSWPPRTKGRNGSYSGRWLAVAVADKFYRSGYLAG